MTRFSRLARPVSDPQAGAPEHDALKYDPTSLALLRTRDGRENPPSDFCEYVAGTRHPSLTDLADYIADPAPGSLTLPATIPLLNANSDNPASRTAHYGVDLNWSSTARATHTLVFGVTGSGKNTRVLDPMRYAAIGDPVQSVVSFSLKSSDFGLIQAACEQAGKRLVVVNLTNPTRSVAWNPLATRQPDIAFDRIRRFSDAVRNPQANDTEFWHQWIKTALQAAWQAGYRSFPHIYRLFSLPTDTLTDELRRHNNPSSNQLADFLHGGSHNADTTLASIIGALTPFLSDSARRVMARDELKLEKLFESPVCLHVEMPETSLETFAPLYKLLSLAIQDELINTAERSADGQVAATLFYDDKPSLGGQLSPERLLTMRSRGIGIVAGVQTISSLELAYGHASQAIVDNFNHKIILPGGPASDAMFFSQASGEQMVTLPQVGNERVDVASRSLLSSADIRSPNYRHVLLGEPATLMFGSLTFQAYLQRSYELPSIAALLRKSRHVTGRERLRKRKLPKPRRLAGQVDKRRSRLTYSETRSWSSVKLHRELERIKADLKWEQSTRSSREWWDGMTVGGEAHMRCMLLLASEIASRDASIGEYYEAFTECETENFEDALALLDSQRSGRRRKRH